MAKILIIDDEELTLEMLSTFLQLSGHEPVGAIDSHQGWSLLDTDLPEVILLDIQLPDQNGLTMCRELRARPDTAQLPIIMISAHAPPLIDEAMNAGATGYLAKPIDLQTLRTALDEVVEV